MSGRRYRNRRHIDLDLDSDRARRRTLNRVTVGLAALLLLALGGAALLQRLADDASVDAGGRAIAVAVPGAIPVEVVRIIDGDTLEVRSAETLLTVRLFGVDTPERGEDCFSEAAARLAALAGAHVQLLPDQRLSDVFGRELRYVYSSDGALIDEALVAAGLGHAWTEDGALRDQIAAAEADARAAGRGCLWD